MSAGTFQSKSAPTRERWAAVPKGWDVGDSRVLYQLEENAKSRAASLRKNGHECELMRVPANLVEGRLVACLMSIRQPE